MAFRKKGNQKPYGSYKVNVRLPNEWKEAVEDAADKEGMTVSNFIRDCIRRCLPANVAKKLPPVIVGKRFDEHED